MEESEGITTHLDPPELSKGRRIAFAISGVVIIFALGFMLLIIFWLLFPYKTAYLEEPIEVLNSNREVAVGDNLVLKVIVEKYADVYPERTEYITCDDGSLTFIDPGTTKNVPPGNYTIIESDIVIPQKLAPGSRCVYHFQYKYEVNPIRHIHKEWESEEFLVKGGQDGR